MTTELEHELLRIARACQRHGADTFSFADGSEISVAEQLKFFTAEEVGPDTDPIVPVLTTVIYFQCYVRQFDGRIIDGDGGGNGPQLDGQSEQFLERLQEANHGQFRWEPGWEVCRCGHDGEVQVMKGDVHRVLVPGEFALDAGPGIRPEEGDFVSLQVFPDSLRLQHGYYYALGEEVADDFDHFGKLRFYFNIEPDDAPTLVESFSRNLNRFQVPFLFKTPVSANDYNRTDAAVLYVAQRFFDITAQIIAALADDVLSHLAPQVPLFSRPLWPGIGFAEDPQDGSSFGRHRCQLVTEGIVNAWKLADEPTDEQFLNCIRQRFTESGISLTTPWRNAGTTQAYTVDNSSHGRSETSELRAQTCARHAVASDLPSNESHSRTNRSRFLEAADRVASRLCRDAIWSNNACNWMGWSSVRTSNGWNPAYTALGPSEDDPLTGINLYSGTSGIARFLIRLETVATDPIRRRTLFGVLKQIRQQKFPGTLVGFYCGSSGIYDTLIEAGRLLEDQNLIDEGVAGLVRLADVDPEATLLDVTHGSSGLIAVLLQRATEFDRADLLETAVRHGQRLLADAVQSDDGWSWNTIPEQGVRHLTGFSHGTSGIAFALLKLHSATGETAYLEAAREAMRYERNHFHKPSRNWIDLRSFDQAADPEVKCLTAWCHGAPGIALTRLIAHILLPEDAEVRADLDAALATTSTDLLTSGNPVDRDWCLCHGQSGNADILLATAEILGDDSYRTTAEVVGDRGLQSIQHDHFAWPCNIGAEGEHPGLMAGLAGVGYFYLRLYDSRVTPSILMPGSNEFPERPPRG